MKNSFLFITLSCIVLSGFAQTTNNHIDTNNVNALINNDALLFLDLSGPKSSFEVPKGGGVHANYAGNIWMGGIAPDQSLKLAAETYNADAGRDFFIGPIATNYDVAYDNKYNRQWKVTREQIETHQASFNNQGYIMPEVIMNWPAHGNIINGESINLAPFIDVNNNNLYDPLNGDYPDVRGDMAIYSILNDDRDVHLASNGEKLVVEIHRMVYSYIGNGALDNTLFINYRIINRSNKLYTDFYFGNWNDFDLGNYDDDYVGSDPQRNLYYGYNGDNDDEFINTPSYGTNPPVIGFLSLNKPLNVFSTYYNGNAGGTFGPPETPLDYYNYMLGKWKDGTEFVYDGNGHVSSGGTTPTKFMFDGNPYTNTGWTEFSVLNQPGDRLGLGSTGPYNFDMNQTLDLDFAIIFSTSNLSNLASVTELFNDTDSIRAFYGVQEYALAVENHQSSIPSFTLFPNPSKQLIHISNLENNTLNQIDIRDLTGKIVAQKSTHSTQTQMNVANLASGIYAVVVKSNNTYQTLKLIVE